MTGNIVPIDAVVVELIEQSQAVLVCATLFEFAIIWLWQANATRFRPIALIALCGWGNLLRLSCPEPSVSLNRLQVWAIASFEVTHTAAGPNVFHLKEEIEMFTIVSIVKSFASDDIEIAQQMSRK